ncbi:hypothetical protein Anas_11219 [Armadillidium nasatum]|uniref:Uncharacterized protein n=1 Tax=Armadillidium nasatum TaxID=96803 RepID=A0A5N5SMQ5_9CRUS|nr:hypothetical protein Anas_11219 [Armadillidium nasatum]
MKFFVFTFAVLVAVLTFVSGEPVADPSQIVDIDLGLQISLLRQCGLSRYNCIDDLDCDKYNLKICKGYPKYFIFPYPKYCACEGSCPY